MAITVSNISVCSTPVDTSYFTSMPTGVTDSRDLFSALGDDLYDKCPEANTFYTIFENDIFRIEASVHLKSDYSGGMDEIKFIDKRPSAPVSTVFSTFIGNLRHCYLALGYDDSTQMPYWLLAGQFYYHSGDWNNVNGAYFGALNTNNRQQIYELISGSQVQPVPPTPEENVFITEKEAQGKEDFNYVETETDNNEILESVSYEKVVS